MTYKPSPLVIVPNELHHAINLKLDEQIAKHPDAEADRNIFYSHLLSFFDEYGYLPEFELSKVDPPVDQN